MAISRCGVLTYSASGTRYDDLSVAVIPGASFTQPSRARGTGEPKGRPPVVLERNYNALQTKGNKWL